MAANWKSIYRSYTAEALTTEKASLQTGLQGGFVSQGSGSVSGTRDTSQLENRLQALVEVERERGGNAPQRTGTVDFSGNGRNVF